MFKCECGFSSHLSFIKPRKGLVSFVCSEVCGYVCVVSIPLKGIQKRRLSVSAQLRDAWPKTTPGLPTPSTLQGDGFKASTAPLVHRRKKKLGCGSLSKAGVPPRLECQHQYYY